MLCPVAAVHQLSFELIKARDLILFVTYHYVCRHLVFLAAGLRWIAGAAVVSVPCMSKNGCKQICVQPPLSPSFALSIGDVM